MNKFFFNILLITLIGVVGYKFLYKNGCLPCAKLAALKKSSCCGNEESHSHNQEESTSHSYTTLESTSDLDSMLSQKGNAIVKVYLDGCPPCKAAAAVYPEIINHFPEISFYNLNVSNADIMNALIEKNIIENPITAAPTFLLLKDGKVVEILQGFNDKDSFIKIITSKLQ